MLSYSFPRKEKVGLLIPPRDKSAPAALGVFLPPLSETRHARCPSPRSAGGSHRRRLTEPPWRIRDAESEMPSAFSEGARHLSPKNQALFEPFRRGTTTAATPSHHFHPPTTSPRLQIHPPDPVWVPSCQAGNEQRHFHKRLPHFTSGDKSYKRSPSTKYAEGSSLSKE